MDVANSLHGQVAVTSEPLPVAALLALAMTGFICIASETLPAGLLPLIADDLHVSNAIAGQTVTAYALGSLLAAIPLTVATAGWRRRSVLLLTIAGFLVFNATTAHSSNFWLTMGARFCAGASAGLAWSLLAGYARRMVAVRQQGQAMAIAMVGTPIALALGVPLGAWLGKAFGWRNAFDIMSGLAALLIVWVLVKVPDYPGQAGHARRSMGTVFNTPGVRPVLATVILWMLGHNVLYTFIAPFIALAGLTGSIDTVLMTFGLAALAGIWGAGRMVDRQLRGAVLSSLAIFALVSLLFIYASSAPAAIYLGVAVWGLTFGGAATLLQTALADSAGNGADVALSMNVVAWNSAIAGAGVLGGVLLNNWGAGSFPWAVLGLTVAGFVVAWSARVHGFPAGPRVQQ
ncbi:MFS transporter [Massilia sp. P8910]|uniref:MFS transporter n=1 Tax=Massilia antarctica TaxID=2765360 RepID=UPI001E3DD2C2|nr:MFS transporter [Massilia antarctica]MCE3604990.1 MFS transporter [Massilia antarctica]